MTSRTWWDHALILTVLLLTAARESEMLPPKPWGVFIGVLVAGLYSWGYMKKPSQEQVEAVANRVAEKAVDRASNNPYPPGPRP